MSTVEAPPSLRIDTITPFCPFNRATLVCTAEPSRTAATSRSRITRPPTSRIGRSWNAATSVGLALTLTCISRPGSRTTPEGSTRFCAETARVTSAADRP
jgi:hypothetical protein